MSITNSIKHLRDKRSAHVFGDKEKLSNSVLYLHCALPNILLQLLVSEILSTCEIKIGFNLTVFLCYVK